MEHIVEVCLVLIRLYGISDVLKMTDQKSGRDIELSSLEPLFTDPATLLQALSESRFGRVRSWIEYSLGQKRG